MSFKPRAVSLGVLVALALNAYVGAVATAETGGHFIAAAEHTVVGGREEGTHHLHFSVDGGIQIGCSKSSYVGTSTTATATEISIAPSWSECFTTSEPDSRFDVDENGCGLVLTIGKNVGSHNTAHLNCPVGAPGIDIEHPSCTIRVPPQTVNGVSYKAVDASPDNVTLTSTAGSVTTHHEGGVCIFLGTTHTGTITGSLTLVAYDLSGKQVDLTATG